MAVQDRKKQYDATRAINLLREYGDFIKEIADSVIEEFSQEINEDTVDKVAMKYANSQGAREAMRLFMRKLNSKTNE